MTLLEAFLEIVGDWQSVFRQNRTCQRAIRQALLSLICLGRRTLTQIIWLSGNQLKSWSIEYFLHSRSPWSVDQLHGPYRTDVYTPLPRWRRNATRPSCLDLVNLLRKQTVENIQIQHEMGIQVTFQSIATLAVA